MPGPRLYFLQASGDRLVVNLYAAITKVEDAGDGTLFVEGIASSEDRDDDGEIILADAVRKAIPKYLRADGTGPLREMHQLKAAGKTTEIWVDDQKLTHVRTVVVDPLAIKKVKTRVYQGFSLGGGATKRNEKDRRIIEEMRLKEISLVDSGSNPRTRYTVVKCEGAGETMDPKTADPTATTPGADATSTAAPPASAPPPDVTTPPAKPDPIHKGMFSVARGAELLDGIRSLLNSCEYEAKAEQDDSPVPEKLRVAMKEYAAAFLAMVEEEVSEVILEDAAIIRSTRVGNLMKALGASLIEAMQPPVIEGAPDVVEKKGAKFSKATKTAHATIHAQLAKALTPLEKCTESMGKGQVHLDVSDLHKCVKAAHEAMTALRGAANDDNDEAEKALGIDDLQKAARENHALRDELTKALSARDDEQRARISATEALRKAIKDRDVLAAELELRPPKGVLKAVATDKAADVSGRTPEEPPKDSVDAIKKAQQRPVSRSF